MSKELEELEQWISENVVTTIGGGRIINQINLSKKILQLKNDIELQSPSKSEDFWNKLRGEFFEECTCEMKGDVSNRKIVNYTPHNLFEWFKKAMQEYATQPKGDNP